VNSYALRQVNIFGFPYFGVKNYYHFFGFFGEMFDEQEGESEEMDKKP